uniref:Uncharacterized protein n=1 Tax=Physcomitrium patens TaxID=3218 RepID=A0A2K1INY2_PHYPA|nr:hypothetical protein PHYPA_027305 [Physcomitrium patens]
MKGFWIWFKQLPVASPCTDSVSSCISSEFSFALTSSLVQIHHSHFCLRQKL